MSRGLQGTCLLGLASLGVWSVIIGAWSACRVWQEAWSVSRGQQGTQPAPKPPALRAGA